MRVFEEFKELFCSLHEAKYSIKQPEAIKRLVDTIEAILG